MKNVNAILFYHSKTLFYQYTIPFYNSSTSKNSIFIKILFFNPFFIISSHPTVQPHFPGLFNSHFYFSLPAPVQHTTHTHYTPINPSKSITTPTHTNTYINPATKPHTNTTQQQSQATHKHNPATKPSHTQTQTHSKTRPPIKNPGQATDPRRRSTNPRRRFETQATDQKPEQTHSKKSSPEQTHSNPFKKKSSPEQTHSNPFKKHHHRSHGANPFNKIITGAIGANPFKKMREMREQRRERRWRAETREQTH